MPIVSFSAGQDIATEFAHKINGLNRSAVFRAFAQAVISGIISFDGDDTMVFTPTGTTVKEGVIISDALQEVNELDGRLYTVVNMMRNLINIQQTKIQQLSDRIELLQAASSSDFDDDESELILEPLESESELLSQSDARDFEDGASAISPIAPVYATVDEASLSVSVPARVSTVSIVERVEPETSIVESAPEILTFASEETEQYFPATVSWPIAPGYVIHLPVNDGQVEMPDQELLDVQAMLTVLHYTVDAIHGAAEAKATVRSALTALQNGESVSLAQPLEVINQLYAMV